MKGVDCEHGRLQAVIAHDLGHAVLRAYRHVTAGANICCLCVYVLGRKATPFWGWALDIHSSRWGFPNSQDGYRCLMHFFTVLSCMIEHKHLDWWSQNIFTMTSFFLFLASYLWAALSVSASFKMTDRCIVKKLIHVNLC